MIQGLRVALKDVSIAYYTRHQCIGLLIGALCYYINLNSPLGYHKPPSMDLFSLCFFGLFVVNVLCFPLARFMYDLVAQPIWDKFNPLLEGHILNLSKLMAILLCWCFAWLIAGLGCNWLTEQKLVLYRAKRHI